MAMFAFFKTALILIAMGLTPGEAKLRWFQDMPPGMMVRMTPDGFQEMKAALREYLPSHLGLDLMLPDPYIYIYRTVIPGIEFYFEWNNIEYKNLDIDIDSVVIDLERGGHDNCVYFDFPAFRDVVLSASQVVGSWLPWKDDVELRIQNFDVDLETSFFVKDGMLFPNLNFIHIDFGKSFLFHYSWLVRTMMHQLLSYSIKIIENSAFIYGPPLFNEVLGPMINHMTDEYTYHLKYVGLLDGGNTTDNFDIDLRPTSSPTVTNKHIDYYAVGGISHGGFDCEGFSPQPMSFRGELPQIVISEATATCWLQHLSRSNFHDFWLTEESYNQLFNFTEHQPLTTSTMAEYFPEFERQFGRDKPMKFRLSFRDPKIEFRETYTKNIKVSSILQIKVMINWKSEGFHEVYYDEFGIYGEGTLFMARGMLYPNIQRMSRYDYGSYTPNYPIRSKMKMTPNDYISFLNEFSAGLGRIRRKLNSLVFQKGIPDPYKIPKFETTLAVSYNTAHFFLKPEDFTYYEKEDLQPITHFSEGEQDEQDSQV